MLGIFHVFCELEQRWIPVRLSLDGAHKLLANVGKFIEDHAGSLNKVAHDVERIAQVAEQVPIPAVAAAAEAVDKVAEAVDRISS